VNNSKLTLSSLLVALFLQLVFATNVSAENICREGGYRVAFFNGVWNKPGPSGALRSLAYLSSIGGKNKNGELVRYSVMYNSTGSTVGSNAFQDLAETFIQRSNEIDDSGTLSNRFELLWEVITDTDTTGLDKISDLHSSLNGVRNSLQDLLLSKSVASISELIFDPPTEENYAEHYARIDSFILQGDKILMVGHSQGNLFLNKSFDYASSKAELSSLAALHIAPASPTLRGEHILADIDLVINALRLQGSSTVPDVNLDLPLSISDLSGHQLVETYLDGSRPGLNRVRAEFNSAMNALVTPTAEASEGALTVTLTWDGTGDIDLHTFEPSGEQVYYQDQRGNSGNLDVDNTTGFGPEHYTTSCESNDIERGTYRFAVNNYAGGTDRLATLQAASARDGVLITKINFNVGPERGISGDNSPIQIFSINVADGPDGAVLFTAE
jgi:hypothetical protein